MSWQNLLIDMVRGGGIRGGVQQMAKMGSESPFETFKDQAWAQRRNEASLEGNPSRSVGDALTSMMGGTPGDGILNTLGRHSGPGARQSTPDILPDMPLPEVEEPDGEDGPTKKFDWKNFFVPAPQQSGGDTSWENTAGQATGKGIGALLKMFI